MANARRRTQRAAQQAQAQANRARNSQLLASYAANPGSIPQPGPAKGVPASTRFGNSETAPGVLPPVGGRPVDWQEQAYGLSATRNLNLANQDATYQRGQLEQEFGYGASGAANPYSRAALLAESFKRDKLGTTNSMASAGQLHSGAYGRAQNENQRNYSIASDQNRRAYDQSVYGVNLGQAQTAANYGIGMDDEAFAALLRALGGGN